VTRVFQGRELNTEYIFGLFAERAKDTDKVSLIGVPYAYQFQKFSANDNIVSVAVLVYVYFPALKQSLPLEIDVWFTYDAAGKGQIAQYDTTFRFWDPLINATVAAWGQKAQVGDAAATQKWLATNIIEGICNTHQDNCKGANKQYPSKQACLATLGTKIRFGQPSEAGRDTVICRMVHEPMVPLRPSVHCPHIGPTGGDMCIDSPDYEQLVLEPVFDNLPFIPKGRKSQLNNGKKLGVF
jgi:hypothetical protein